MPEPIFVAMAAAIATAVSGKVTETALKAGRKASSALVALVKQKFSKEPSAQAALDAAVTDPDGNAGRLAGALELVAGADPEFGEQLKSEYERGELNINAASGATVNSVSGVVEGSVFQVGRVENWNGPQPPQ